MGKEKKKQEREETTTRIGQFRSSKNWLQRLKHTDLSPSKIVRICQEPNGIQPGSLNGKPGFKTPPPIVSKKKKRVHFIFTIVIYSCSSKHRLHSHTWTPFRRLDMSPSK